MSDIELLLQGGADANMKNENDFSLLMSSASKNNIEAVKTLIEYGAKIEAKDNKGYTALDYAIRNNHLDMVKLLVSLGSLPTDNSYMLSVSKDFKEITKYFDTLDDNKKIFLKNN